MATRGLSNRPFLYSDSIYARDRGEGKYVKLHKLSLITHGLLNTSWIIRGGQPLLAPVSATAWAPHIRLIFGLDMRSAGKLRRLRVV